jgi:hypothetical protein
LARLHLGDDLETIDRYEDALREHGSWWRVIETGVIDPKHVDLLFHAISDDTHGTSDAFVDRWTEIQSIYHVDEDEEVSGRKSIHPFVYGLLIHDVILIHRPFVRGNGRLARLILSHCMLRARVLPPRFDVRSTYYRHLTKRTVVDTLAFVRADEETKRSITLDIIRKVLDFARFISLSSKREYDLATGRTNGADVDTPFEVIRLVYLPFLLSFHSGTSSLS